MVFNCGKHLHDKTTSLKGERSTHKTILTPPHVIEMPETSQKRDHVYVCYMLFFRFSLAIFKLSFRNYIDVDCFGRLVWS